MAARQSVDPVQLLEKHLASASPDLLREMVAAFANAMMSVQADQVCGADYGQRTAERVNRRNGYRAREWDTRVGTVELAIPKLREGCYYPDWLLTHRRRAEQALVTVVATAYLLGVSTRRVERLAEQLGVKSLSRSQVSEMAAHLDAQISAFRERPLDAGPYTFVWADALTVKVREDARVAGVHALVATGVNADGHREILGLDVASAKDGAGWLALWRGLVARGLSGVQLVTADAHPGLAAAIGAALPGASWQRCRSHYLRNLLTKVPKSAQPHVATQVRTIFDQADAAAVQAGVRPGRDRPGRPLPEAAEHLEAASMRGIGPCRLVISDHTCSRVLARARAILRRCDSPISSNALHNIASEATDPYNRPDPAAWPNPTARDYRRRSTPPYRPSTRPRSWAGTNPRRANAWTTANQTSAVSQQPQRRRPRVIDHIDAANANHHIRRP